MWEGKRYQHFLLRLVESAKSFRKFLSGLMGVLDRYNVKHNDK